MIKSRLMKNTRIVVWQNVLNNNDYNNFIKKD